MSELTEASRALAEAVTAAEPDAEEVESRCRAVLARVRTAHRLSLHAALGTVADALTAVEDPFVLGLVGRLCGEMIEAGADPERARDAVLDRLPLVLERTRAFLDYGREHGVPEATDESESGIWIGRDGLYIEPAALETLNVERPELAKSWDHFEAFATGVIAVLERLPDARKVARQHPDWAEVALDADHARLERVLRVLDDERLLVLHPEARKGYRVRLHGVTDNFQLHTLLADALITGDDDGLPGDRPTARIVAVARGEGPAETDLTALGSWTLYHWVGLQQDGAFNEEDVVHCRIWNEGLPADIQLFEGTRVVLLGPPDHQRAWRARRTFAHMPASVEIDEVLARRTVDDWLRRIRRAPRTRVMRK